MSRDEAILKLADEFQKHYPHPVFGCECVIPTPEEMAVGVFPSPPIEPLDHDWGLHVAEIAFEHAKGF